MKITETNRKWWIFAAMAAALSIVFLDQTAIAVALPPIQKDLHLSNVELQWVVNSYLVALAAIVTFGGKLGDVFGHKRIYLLGITIFTLASMTCAFAISGHDLLISRGIQGIGGALMIPVTGVIIAHAFPPNQRGRAIGLYIGTASIFISAGPFLSGLLIHYSSWRWVFLINFPIAVFSICLGLLSVPRHEKRSEIKPLDWPGFITLSVFIVSLIIALMEGISWGWSSTPIISLFITAAIFIIAFLIIEKKAADPIVHLELFKQHSFLGASLCLLTIQCAFSSIVFWAILFQNVMGYSALISGLFYLPVTLPVMFMAPLSGWLRDTYGPRLPAMSGAIIVALGAIWIAISVFKENYLAMLPGFILFGIGPSLIYSSSMATTMLSVPLQKRGMASGISSGIRQLASALGVALIGSVLNTMQHHKVLAGFSANKSFIFAFSIAMFISAGFVILTFFASFILPQRLVFTDDANENFKPAKS